MALRGKPNLRFKVNNAINKNQQQRMPWETEKHSQMMIGKQIGGQRLGARSQDGSGTTKSEDFF